MRFQKVNKKSKLDLIRSKMGLLRIKQSRALPKKQSRALPKKYLLAKKMVFLIQNNYLLNIYYKQDKIVLQVSVGVCYT